MEDFKRIAENWDKLSGKSTREDRWDYFDGCICIFERNKESRMMKGEVNEQRRKRICKDAIKEKERIERNNYEIHM